MAQQNKTRLPKAVSVSEKGRQKRKNHPKSLRFSLESIPSPSSSSDNFSPDTFSPPTETYANTLSETHSKENNHSLLIFIFCMKGEERKEEVVGMRLDCTGMDSGLMKWRLMHLYALALRSRTHTAECRSVSDKCTNLNQIKSNQIRMQTSMRSNLHPNSVIFSLSQGNL